MIEINQNDWFGQNKQEKCLVPHYSDKVKQFIVVKGQHRNSSDFYLELKIPQSGVYRIGKQK